MRDFLQGQQYDLTTESKCNKSLLFVKLTDSALHSIESFLQTQGSSSEKPTIQFMSNNGTITLPVSGQEIKYGFTLSKFEADGSSFQCIQHSKQRCLKSLGRMQMKMHIHANEDSYATTKCKMAAVEKEQKNLCTKEIKPNGSYINRKGKIKHPGNVYPSKIIPPLSQTFIKPKDKASSDTAVSKEPVRKRIIHILAAKPYKKPDVFLRLMKEGINDSDRKTVSRTLDEVGYLKCNMYTLSDQLWSEVDDSWKFSPKEELELIRRRKLRFLKSGVEVPPSVSQNSVQKRVDDIHVFKEPQSKKQRISHYNKLKVPEQTVKAVSSECNDINIIKKIRGENHKKVNLFKQMNGVANGACETNGKYSRRGMSTHFISSGSKRMECNGSSPTEPYITDCVTEPDSSNDMQKYGKITSIEQRSQYAVDFHGWYKEYLELHSKMKNVDSEVSSLINHLRMCTEGSEEMKKTRLEICNVYKTKLLSNNHLEVRKKYFILQSKLSHIKNLIEEYDSQNNNSIEQQYQSNNE